MLYTNQVSVVYQVLRILFLLHRTDNKRRLHVTRNLLARSVACCLLARWDQQAGTGCTVYGVRSTLSGEIS